jgi:hypothetical protein
MLPNLRPIIFDLTLIGWFISIKYFFFNGNIIFDLGLFDLRQPFREHN